MSKNFTTIRKYCAKWLQNYSANIVKSSLQPLETCYREFFKKQRELPKFHARNSTTPSFPIDKQTAKITGSHLYIQKIGWMKFEGSNPYPNGEFVSGRVKYECGNWYAYITYKVELTRRPQSAREVGIDRNVGQIALSDGQIIHLPDLERKARNRKKYQKRMARQVKGSNRRKITRRRVQRAFMRERSARANWAHQVSRRIANNYHIAYIEGLNTSGMTKSAKGTVENPGKRVKQKTGLNRSILNSGWGKLEQCLSYKMIVEKVDPKYTSQTCSRCGAVDKASRKTQSEFKCTACGHEENADVNAALNILAAGNTVTGHGGVGVAPPVKCQKDSLACLPS